jgi:hypothetical protein
MNLVAWLVALAMGLQYPSKDSTCFHCHLIIPVVDLSF